MLQGEGVHIQLVGNTDIEKGVTLLALRNGARRTRSRSFEATLPDGPVLDPDGLRKPVLGSPARPDDDRRSERAQLIQNTPVNITGCPPSVSITRVSVRGGTAFVTVRQSKAGTVKIAGPGLRTTIKRGLGAGRAPDPRAASRAPAGRRRRSRHAKIRVRRNAHRRLTVRLHGRDRRGPETMIRRAPTHQLPPFRRSAGDARQLPARGARIERRPPSAAECPNEARRVEQGSTYLPDCRAFELASPSLKNGEEVETAPIAQHQIPFQAAAEGPGIAYLASGGLRAANRPVCTRSIARVAARRARGKTSAQPGIESRSDRRCGPEVHRELRLLQPQPHVWRAGDAAAARKKPRLGRSPRTWRRRGPSEQVTNLYLWNGSGPANTFTLITKPKPENLAEVAVGQEGVYNVDGASTDCTRGIFESPYVFHGAPAGSLYKWSGQTIETASVLPDGKAAEGVTPGQQRRNRFDRQPDLRATAKPCSSWPTPTPGRTSASRPSSLGREPPPSRSQRRAAARRPWTRVRASKPPAPPASASSSPPTTASRSRRAPAPKPRRNAS